MNSLNTYLVLALMLCLTIGCGEKKEAGSPERPNIIFILIDDQTAGMMGYEGHPFIQTPNVDRLAEKGVIFSNAFVTTSICAASRASILTGRFERTHGYTFGKSPMSDEMLHDSYPLILRQNGYRTGFAGKFGVQYAADSSTEKLFDYFRPSPINAPHFVRQEDGTQRHSAEIVGDHAVEFLAATDDRPFCLSLSFNAVHAVDGNLTPGNDGHYPYPAAVSALYTNTTMPLPRLSHDSIYDAHPDFLKESLNRERYFWRWDTAGKYQVNMQAYCRMISGYDRVIGRVLDTLESRELTENTMIIFTADNGYYMGNRGFAGKWSHYEESIRVPMIVYDPKRSDSSGRSGKMALNIDIAATMLDYAGIDIPEGYEGRSLLPILKRDSVNWRDEFYIEHRMDHPKIPKYYGVRTERYVYANYYEQDPPFEYLHDLETDPNQLINLAPKDEFRDLLERVRAKAILMEEDRL